ncbi:MAG: SdpI family protein [Candidatus Peribacteraceae bacterium]|nr:SdpI family protein [Candidatus Peribacteraceae bacterium]
MDTAPRSGLSLLRILQLLILLGMFLAAALLYRVLPEQIPTHWNFMGQVDQYSGKVFGTFLLPSVALVLSLLFPLFQRIDPKRENYAAFAHAWEVFQLALVGFMAYIFAVQMYTSLHPEASVLVGRFVMFGIGVLLILMGNYMGKIRQNFFVGLRTPWTIADPEVWGKSQRFGGWCFVLGGLAIIVVSILWVAVPALLISIFVFVVFLPMVYSYMLFRRKN